LFVRVVMDAIQKVITSDADKYEGLIIGIVVVIAVALTQLRQPGRQGKRFFAGALGVVSMVNLALAAGVLAMLFGQNAQLSGWKLGSIVAAAVLVLLGLARWGEGRRRDGAK